MLALTTSNVNAKEYVSDDTYTLPSEFHDVFNNYFSGNKSYLYFPYKCDTNVCYFGIDSDGNYLDITYIPVDGSDFVLNYSTGIDENFSVTGNNIYKKPVNNDIILVYSIIFFVLVIMVIFIV